MGSVAQQQTQGTAIQRLRQSLIQRNLAGSARVHILPQDLNHNNDGLVQHNVIVFQQRRSIRAWKTAIQ